MRNHAGGLTARNKSVQTISCAIRSFTRRLALPSLFENLVFAVQSAIASKFQAEELEISAADARTAPDGNY
jgi:hypothetical protein